MYIPSAPGSGQVIFQGDTATDKTNENRFWAIVNANPGLLRNAGRVAQRNENYGPWSNSVDVRLSQELPSFFKGHKAVFAFDILNFGNLLNKRWGRIDEIGFQSNGGLPRAFANFVGIDPASGKYVYQVPSTVTDFTTRQARGESQWALQATFRYEF
jgi:predicted DNA-binding WGR domain protein